MVQGGLWRTLSIDITQVGFIPAPDSESENCIFWNCTIA